MSFLTNTKYQTKVGLKLCKQKKYLCKLKFTFVKQKEYNNFAF